MTERMFAVSKIFKAQGVRISLKLDENHKNGFNFLCWIYGKDLFLWLLFIGLKRLPG